MKKILLILYFLFTGFASFGQNAEVQKEINEIIFYGVDFSLSQSYGMDEDISQITETFKQVNDLLVNEGGKYDIARYFKKTVTAKPIRQLNSLNQKISSETFYSESDIYQITNEQLAEEIKSLPIKETEGIGLIFVAELLNKNRSRTTYHIIFFDIASREILDKWKSSGRAKGFGLRNYWAGSIYNMLENVRIE